MNQKISFTTQKIKLINQLKKFQSNQIVILIEENNFYHKDNLLQTKETKMFLKNFKNHKI